MANIKEKTVKYTQLINELSNICAKYELNAISSRLKEVSAEIKEFKVNVPLIGSFSSGKTSLINAMLGQRKFAVEVNPETAIPAEIFYSTTPQNFVTKSDGKIIQIDDDTLLKNKFLADKDSLLKVSVNHKAFEKFQNINIVDMPGLDSGIEMHMKAIDNYINKSLAYIMTIDSECGLKNSMINFLNEYKLYNLPAYVLITKSDLKLEHEEIEQIINDVKENIKSILGIKEFKIAAVSANNKIISPMIEILEEIENRSDEIFTKKYNKVILIIIEEIEKYINKRLQSGDLSINEINEQIEKLKTQISEFEGKLETETAALNNQVSGCTDKIKEFIREKLISNGDLLVSTILSRGDVNSKISTIVRAAAIEGIKKEFEPKIQKYFKNISDVLPDDFNLNQDFNFESANIKTAESVKNTIKQAIPAVLAILGLHLGGPIGAAIGMILGILIDNTYENYKQNEQKRLAEEKYYNEIVPDVTNKIVPVLNQTLLDHIEQIEAEIRKDFDRQKETFNSSLAELLKQKQMKEEIEVEVIKDLNLNLTRINDLKKY